MKLMNLSISILAEILRSPHFVRVAMSALRYPLIAFGNFGATSANASDILLHSARIFR